MVRCPPIPLGLHGGEASKRTGHRPGAHRRHPHTLSILRCPLLLPLPFPRPLLRLPYVFSSVSPNSPLHNHPHPNLALALPLTPISHPPPAPTSPSDRVVARYRDRRARTRSDVGRRGEPAQADVRGMGQPPRSVGESARGTSKRERESVGERERERETRVGPASLRAYAPTRLCAYEHVRVWAHMSVSATP